jgi:hypothetical protein
MIVAEGRKFFAIPQRTDGRVHSACGRDLLLLAAAA